jgi:hypothetical protein
MRRDLLEKNRPASFKIPAKERKGIQRGYDGTPYGDP